MTRSLTIEERLDRIERKLGMTGTIVRAHDLVAWEVAVKRLKQGDRTLFDCYLDQHGGAPPPRIGQ